MTHVVVKHHIPGRVRFRLGAAQPLDGLSEWLRLGLLSVQGVQSVRVNEAAQSLVVSYDADLIQYQQISERLQQLDWQQAVAGDSEHQFTRGDIALNTLGLLAACFIPKGYAAASTLTLITPTLGEGLEQLKDKKLGVEVLDAIAIGLSAWRGDYKTAMLTQTLLSTGEYMEQETSRNSDNLLAELMQPKHSTVWVARDGQEQQISSEELVLGDEVLLGPGDMVPADGHIVDGTALVNQASLTGESVPVRREDGAYLYSGTAIHDGKVRMRIDKVGSETTTAQIAAIIAQSLGEKSQTQLATQEMAERRVKITLAIGTAVFAMTRDLERLASVFLVDYSCALKLSTPVTFKSMMYRAAKQGLLLKGGRAMENLAQVDTCVFDKTGTLTYGDLEVTDVICLREQENAKELLAMAASVEEHCNHPLAQAIVNAAKHHALPHIEHGEVDYVIAHGLKSFINEHPLVIGSRHYLEAHEGVDFSSLEQTISRLESEGKHLLFMANEHQPIGVIGLRDTLREEVQQTLQQLRDSGIRNLVLLTGDTASKARQLTEELGFDLYFAEATPDSKAEVVDTLQQQGHKVLFVGDGVNDAPALSQADVGLAMATGTDLAHLAADVVLLQDNLQGIAQARQLAQEAMTLINSNIRLTEVVNSGIMLAAAMGWLNPAASALLHNGTTLAVLTRAMAARNG
ncbi:ATPase, P-type (transporting), HAD superfamily, subfamily IC/heavy metal translocating P-type ATPase [Ferrimonas sediminum]|uniref:P-type Zn(2+) transporter n=1 Tax=Ferrimonas sediminum TaxID=718193 RepID=A0A1G8PZ38_9GAMM|nr:heavy metal translocating P-type ATPase [Ferrimonas sediminum]SDI97752.1 ATPase, P-type (transporting), HAD superfamily, subfamily IC/heavy metal translocating P-type ATPase [Ferrimonas sediminum]